MAAAAVAVLVSSLVGFSVRTPSIYHHSAVRLSVRGGAHLQAGVHISSSNSHSSEVDAGAGTSGITLALQSMHVAAACSSLLAPMGEGPMDRVVASMWATYESAALVTHQPMFEASVAVLAFVVWIAFFESIHLWWPKAEEVRTCASHSAP